MEDLPKQSLDLKRQPPENLFYLSDQELEMRVCWSQQINSQLKSRLDHLQAELKSEWLAKEKLLDQLLIRDLGAGEAAKLSIYLS